jgi:hypothetical protein
MAAATARRRRVGVLEPKTYTAGPEWGAIAAVPTLKRQFYAIMPQVVAAWARGMGHRVSGAGALLPRMPLALYCAPDLCFVPRHYDGREFYERLVALLEGTSHRR